MSKTKNVKYNLELFHSIFIQGLPEDFGISTAITGVLIFSPNISLSFCGNTWIWTISLELWGNACDLNTYKYTSFMLNVM